MAAPHPPDVKTRSAWGIVPPRVLVVDAEPLIRWSLCAALAAAGFEPVVAATRDEARRVALGWPHPVLVLLDLPTDGSGGDLIADVRMVQPDCRFLAMSTARRDRIAPDGVETIDKPFDLAAVVARVIATLAGVRNAGAFPVT